MEKQLTTNELISHPDRKIETVFKAEPPLQTIENGHGYMGVLLRDTINDLLQCHICGEWKAHLSTHIAKTHKIMTDAYKEKYQLPVGCPLVSVGISAKHRQRAIDQKNIALLANIRKNGAPLAHTALRKKWKRKNFYKRVYNLSWENKHNLCPEQIVRRYMIIVDALGKEPSVRQLTKHDEPLWMAIRRRFKTLNKFRKKNNFEVIKRAKLFESDELIGHLKKFFILNGAVPRSKDFVSGSPNTNTIVRHFGSWHRALILSGFDESTHRRYRHDRAA